MKCFLCVCFFLFFFCLFGVLRPFWEFFTHIETPQVLVKGFKFLTYSKHLWLLSSEGSLTCPIYCNTEHLFIIIISEDPWHSHLLPNFWQWNCHYLFLQLRSVEAKIRTPNRRQGEHSYWLCHCYSMYFLQKKNLSGIYFLCNSHKLHATCKFHTENQQG